MQSFTSWNPEYNTGNFVIDHQNRRLFLLIDDLEIVASQADYSPDLVNVVFEEVTQYTDFHFKVEEEIMAEVSYSEIEIHKQLHDNFFNQLKLSKNNNIDRTYCRSLKQWMIRHISSEDQKIVSELISGHGVV